jgi:type II secretory pathway pseudopilin PulG
MSNNHDTSRRFGSSESGFSLLEAIVAIFVLTVGLLGTAAALSYAIHYGTISRNVTVAKSMIVSQIEEIETLRNSRRLDFKQIANVGSVDNTDTTASFAGFSNGFKPIALNPGPDGVNGTDDDTLDPGPDGTFGNGDDFDNPALARSGYERRVVITNLGGSMKKIAITVRYLGSGGRIGEIDGVCYLNDEGRTTR